MTFWLDHSLHVSISHCPIIRHIGTCHVSQNFHSSVPLSLSFSLSIYTYIPTVEYNSFIAANKNTTSRDEAPQQAWLSGWMESKWVSSGLLLLLLLPLRKRREPNPKVDTKKAIVHWRIWKQHKVVCNKLVMGFPEGLWTALLEHTLVVVSLLFPKAYTSCIRTSRFDCTYTWEYWSNVDVGSRETWRRREQERR